MLKFKAFCVDYWQFLCLQPLHGAYKRYVHLVGRPCHRARGCEAKSPPPRPAHHRACSGRPGVPVTGQRQRLRELWVTLQLGLIVPSSPRALNPWFFWGKVLPSGCPVSGAVSLCFSLSGSSLERT